MYPPVIIQSESGIAKIDCYRVYSPSSCDRSRPPESQIACHPVLFYSRQAIDKHYHHFCKRLTPQPLKSSNIESSWRPKKTKVLNLSRHIAIARSLIHITQLREGMSILIEVTFITKFIGFPSQAWKSWLAIQALVVWMLEPNGMTELMQEGNAIETTRGD